MRSGAIEEDAARIARGPVATLVAPDKAAALAATALAAGISTRAAEAAAAAAEAPTAGAAQKKKKLKKGEVEPQAPPLTIGALLIGSQGAPPQALPAHLWHAAPDDPLLFLRSEAHLQPLQVSLPGDEIEPERIFTSLDNFARSQPARVQAPLASFFTEKLGAPPPPLRNHPLITERWRARLDNPMLPTCVASLRALEPRVLSMQASLHAHDTYSDSESDDDEEKLSFRALLPTAALARSLFTGAADVAASAPEWSPLQSLNATALAAIGGASAKPAPSAVVAAADDAPLRRTPYEEADQELRERLASAQTQAVEQLAEQLTRWNDKVSEPRLKTKPLIM